MGDHRDGGALNLLTVVSIVGLAGFAFLMFIAAPGTDGASIGFGIGGICAGLLAAATWQMHRQRRRSEPPTELTLSLAERLQALEQEQQRMMELEERVDFAERLLARAQEDVARGGARGEGRPT